VETGDFYSVNIRFSVASMGPPIYIGGNTHGEGGRRPLQDRFNGATDLHRWKQNHRYRDRTGAVTLQWGHRFTSVETAKALNQLVESSKASMGPPIYIGGNDLLFFTKGKPTKLQWGHRFTSVET